MVILRIAFLWENLYCFNFPNCLFQRTCFHSPLRIQTQDAFDLERWVFLMMMLSVKMIMIRIITMVTMVMMVMMVMMVTLIVILQRWL